jgi:mannose-6-phosphate isomerase-like protein (cupin superfamily)
MTWAQDRKVTIDWAPKPNTLQDYTGVNKVITRLPEVLAKHKGQANWSEDVIETERYSAKWISMAAGEKTRTQFHTDDRTTWVVWGGQIRFTIHGQAPFVASKGFLVQVPFRVPYSMETVGSEPSLRFEVTRGGAIPSYPATREEQNAPPPRDGHHYVKVSYPPTLVAGGMDSYTDKNKPYLDFMKEFVEKYPTAARAADCSWAIMTIRPPLSAAWAFRFRPPPTGGIFMSAMTSSGSSWKARSPMKWKARA